MPRSKIEKWAQETLHHAGITINGSMPWDMQVHNQDLHLRVLQKGSLGLGESYMEG